MNAQLQSGNRDVEMRWPAVGVGTVSTAVSKGRRSPYSSLHFAAELTAGLVWLYGLLGAIGSIVVMTTTDEADSGLINTRPEHPYVGLGLALLLGVAFTSAFLAVFARWAAAWAVSKMTRPEY